MTWCASLDRLSSCFISANMANTFHWPPYFIYAHSVQDTVAWQKWVTHVIALSSSLCTVKLRVNWKRKYNISWHTVNQHDPDGWVRVFCYFIHSQCSVPEADNKIFFFRFCFYFINFSFKACYLQNPRGFFSEYSIYYLPSLPSNIGKFWPC